MFERRNYSDAAVVEKYPFLAKPLTVENMNTDAAVLLVSELIKDAKESYISSARDLKKLGFPIPTSSEEFMNMKTNKLISERLKDVNAAINDILKIKESERSERDKMVLSKLEDERLRLDTKFGGLYSTIKFVEGGCYGALGLLRSGISGQEVLKEWKGEALGYGKRSESGRSYRNHR